MKVKSLKNKEFKKRGVESKEVILEEASINQLSLIGALIDTSIIDINKEKEIEEKIKGFVSKGEAEEIINFLYENQRCYIDGGFNYGQKEILKKLKSFI